MLHQKVTNFLFLLFVLASCKPVENENRIGRNLIKRQLLQSFISNPIFHRVFDNGNPYHTLADKFLNNENHPRNSQAYNDYTVQLSMPQDVVYNHYYHNHIGYGEEDDQDDYHSIPNTTEDDSVVILPDTNNGHSEETSDNPNRNIMEYPQVISRKNTKKDEENISKNSSENRSQNNSTSQNEITTDEVNTGNNTIQVMVNIKNGTIPVLVKTDAKLTTPDFLNETNNSNSSIANYSTEGKYVSKIFDNKTNNVETLPKNATNPKLGSSSITVNNLPVAKETNGSKNNSTTTGTVIENPQFVSADKLFTSSVNTTTMGPPRNSSSAFIQLYEASQLPNISNIPLQNVTLGKYLNKNTFDNKSNLHNNHKMKENVTEKNPASQRNGTGERLVKAPASRRNKAKTVSKIPFLTEDKMPNIPFYDLLLPTTAPYLSRFSQPYDLSVNNKKHTQNNLKKVPSKTANQKLNSNRSNVVRNSTRRPTTTPNWSDVLLEKMVSHFIQKSLLGAPNPHDDYQKPSQTSSTSRFREKNRRNQANRPSFQSGKINKQGIQGSNNN